MFAIIKTGGKQYKVAENDIIKVEKLACASGDPIEFTEILMMGQGSSVKIGAPFIANARVFGTVLDQIRDDKVIIFKKKRRHNYRRKNGHRQYLSVIQITDILTEGQTPKAKASPIKDKEKVEKPGKESAPKAEIKAKTPVKKVTSEAATKTKAPTKKAPPKAEKTVKKTAPKAKKPSEK